VSVDDLDIAREYAVFQCLDEQKLATFSLPGLANPVEERYSDT